MMVNFEKKFDSNSIEEILEALENADSITNIVRYSRMAAIWVSKRNPGITKFGPEVERIFNAKNLDRSEFMKAFTKMVLSERKKAKPIIQSGSKPRLEERVKCNKLTKIATKPENDTTRQK